MKFEISLYSPEEKEKLKNYDPLEKLLFEYIVANNNYKHEGDAMAFYILQLEEENKKLREENQEMKNDFARFNITRKNAGA